MNACSSPRACAKVHPTQVCHACDPHQIVRADCRLMANGLPHVASQVKQELIWVWAECGPEALEESKLKDPVINKYKEEHQGEYIHQYHNYARDLPGGFAVWVSSPTPFAHPLNAASPQCC